MRYRLRTLLIVLALVPPVLAGVWNFRQVVAPIALLLVAVILVVAILVSLSVLAVITMIEFGEACASSVSSRNEQRSSPPPAGDVQPLSNRTVDTKALEVGAFFLGAFGALFIVGHFYNQALDGVELHADKDFMFAVSLFSVLVGLLLWLLTRRFNSYF